MDDALSVERRHTSSHAEQGEGESYRNTEKLHTRIFRIGELPVNHRSASMPSSIFDSAHRRLVELLIEARKAGGLTQKEVGLQVGKSQSFVSMIERHQRRVDVVEFIALCRALGKDPDTFFALLVVEQA